MSGQCPVDALVNTPKASNSPKTIPYPAVQRDQARKKRDISDGRETAAAQREISPKIVRDETDQIAVAGLAGRIERSGSVARDAGMNA